MKRRTFLKLLGLTAISTALPIKTQAKQIRKTLKLDGVKIICSHNVSRVEKNGIGHYTIHFKEPASSVNETWVKFKG